MIDKILEFIKQAGEIAKTIQEKIDLSIDVNQKDSKVFNVVTQADLDISELFEKFVKKEFSHLNHIIVDEEKLSILGNNPLEKIENAEYAFVLDPIDGTQPYSLKMPEYGISVGVLRYGKPYIGVLYCPAINEAVYFDGKKSYWLQNAFLQNEKKVELAKKEPMPRAIIFDSAWNVMINNNTNFSKDTIMGLYSAVMHMLYIATGRGRSYFFGVFPWDIAGGWGIIKDLGFEIINYKNRKILEKISSEDFGEKLRVNDVHIICRPQDFDYIKNISDLRDDS